MWKPFAKLQINPFLSELRLEYCRVTSASRTSTSKLPPTTMERLTNVFSVLDLDVEDDRPSAAASSSSSSELSVFVFLFCLCLRVMRRWTMDNLFAGKEKKAVKNDKPNQQERVAPSGAYTMPLVWIDLEMTGLDVEVDRIIEIACIITDGKLTKLVEGPELVIHQTEECMNKMGEWCQTHHGASGLTERVIQSTVSEREAELQVFTYFFEF
ncbi:At2g26970 [Linum perenne]